MLAVRETYIFLSALAHVAREDVGQRARIPKAR